ncbi:MAG: hypothetical protein ACD_47C00221G0001 [uncultured bacterium]|nr:MAG: hypothetical protein ACD_47C00221G0001 [uncultured bacterium]
MTAIEKKAPGVRAVMAFWSCLRSSSGGLEKSDWNMVTTVVKPKPHSAAKNAKARVPNPMVLNPMVLRKSPCMSFTNMNEGRNISRISVISSPVLISKNVCAKEPA